MKKYFIFSDVHNHYDALMSDLNKQGFDINNKDHWIISCGDLLDRGPKPLECLTFVNKMLDKNRAICIKGNHEILLEDVYKRNYFSKFDERNGTLTTYKRLAEDLNLIKDNTPDIIKIFESELVQKYLKSLRWFYETEKYIFCHAWIPEEKDWRNGSWENSVWEIPYEHWAKGEIVEEKTIVCGHYHTYSANSKYHDSGLSSIEEVYAKASIKELEIIMSSLKQGTSEYIDIVKKYMDFSPFKDKGIWDLDAQTYFSNQVNVITRSKWMKEVSLKK